MLRGRWARNWKSCQVCKTTNLSHKALGLCQRCYRRQQQRQAGPRAKPKKKNKCVDCSKLILDCSTRCLSCRNKYLWAKGCFPRSDPNLCVDCGTPIQRSSTRCVVCYKHHRKEQAEENYPKKCRPEYPGYVYVLQGGGYCKIGSTTQLNDRVARLSTLMPFPISLMCSIATEDMFALEAQLHSRFADKRTNGEWFRLESEDIDYIQRLAVPE